MRYFVVFLLLAASAAAQHNNHSPATNGPVSLIPGLGSWKHRIDTKNAEAQKYFDQGLILIYSFNRPEAMRSFRKAAELDPQAPMVWWGISLASAPYVNMDGDPTFNIKESCGALAKGLALNPEPRESAYLQAAQARCPDYADPTAYVQASKALAERFPDDLDAQVLFAESIMIPARWRWYASDGKPAEGMPEAERALEAVLRRDPTHPGANHYYIHAVEASPTPERAVASAQRLMGIVPAAGHIVHMPGHIWLVLGDFNMTVAVNERAVEVDRKYFAGMSPESPYYVYYLHNLHFILYARDMQGRVADARKAERTMLETIAPIRKSMPDLAGVFSAMVTFSQLRTGRWDEVLAGPKPSDGDVVALYARTLALAMKGRSAEARGARVEFDKARAKVDRTSQWGVNKMGDVMDLAATVLEARTSAGAAAAVPFWRQAVAIQDRLAYDEPPGWYYPVRESLGAALLLSGDAAEAETVFRDALRRSPHNGRVLFGLLESLKAQRKADAVESVQKEFDAAWKGADLKLRLEHM